jgi:hypothetical protein
MSNYRSNWDKDSHTGILKHESRFGFTSAALLFNPCLGHGLMDTHTSTPSAFFGQSANAGEMRIYAPVPTPLSANVIVCGEVLVEAKTDLLSAIRIMTAITVSAKQSHVRFWSIAFVSSPPGDYEQHRMLVQMTGPDGGLVASAQEYEFQYGYKIDPKGNGGFSLRTEFSVDVTRLRDSGTYWMGVYVDGQIAARTPITLRR